MRLSDQHIHSAGSPDCDTPLPVMARAAREIGVEHLCFTDHIDIDDCLTGGLNAECPGSWSRVREGYLAALPDVPAGVELCLGMELGEANHCPELALKLAAEPELDLVLGSLHNLRNTPDFYYLRYESEAQCEALNRRYLEELLELSALPCFDVMAHIGYTRRYMRRAGFEAALDRERFGDLLEALLRNLIEKGKGIEVNCSGLREGAGTFPGLPVLRLYRELGGEIITVGSDAHSPSTAGTGIAQGFELLREAGFRHVALFRRRKPEFQSIL
jgi:histidinol-phosphatase (PHP family)